MAYPDDYAVPTKLFCGWIVDQHAVHDAVAAIAAVVPDPILTNAGHHKKVGRDPSVNDAGRRPLLGQECGRRIVRGIGNGLHSEIRAVVVREKAPPCAALRGSRISAENRGRYVDAGSRARDHVAAPFRVAGIGNRRSEDQSAGYAISI